MTNPYKGVASSPARNCTSQHAETITAHATASASGVGVGQRVVPTATAGGARPDGIRVLQDRQMEGPSARPGEERARGRPQDRPRAQGAGAQGGCPRAVSQGLAVGAGGSSLRTRGSEHIWKPWRRLVLDARTNVLYDGWRKEWPHLPDKSTQGQAALPEYP
jgi:hypothetical protein